MKTISQLLLANVRKADVAVRYGGDEFVVIMPDSPKSDAAKVSDRIKEMLDKLTADSSITVSLSIGIRESDGKDITEIMDLVDRSMYMDKDRKEAKNIYNMEENLEDLLAEE